MQRRLYRTARWRAVREMVIGRDGGLCQECQRLGLVKPGTEVDHKIKAVDRPEMFWDLENLELLCASCHSTKTAKGG